MGSPGGRRAQELSVVCLHNNAIVARCILVTILHCGTPEARPSAVYIVSSVGTSLNSSTFRQNHFLPFLLLALDKGVMRKACRVSDTWREKMAYQTMGKSHKGHYNKVHICLLQE